MVTELAKPFDLSLPAVSRHIKVLERARLIVRAVDGRIHRCSLDAQSLQTAEAWLERYRHFWKERSIRWPATSKSHSSCAQLKRDAEP
jgi:DNA-binding transcriptional ArsR family regulator